jgi:transposase
MPKQHTITEQRRRECEATQGIIVPLDLPEFEMVSQSLQADGCIQVHVRAKKAGEACPKCGEISEKVHDIRESVKRDSVLRTYHIRLVVEKRRFRCARCQRPFTETESACGKYKRTTRRFRQHIAQQASQRPITHVAKEVQVGPRFVQDCLSAWIEEHLQKQGRTLDERAKLPTPQLLGIDEFATRKGHRYETILCDLEHRNVLEVCESRKKDKVVKLLQRLEKPEEVLAVSMDMSASFRPAVQEALPHAQIVVDHFHVIQHVMKAFRQLGPSQRGTHSVAWETAPLFEGQRRTNRSRSPRTGEDWSSASGVGKGMAIERNIAQLVCDGNGGRCGSKP